MTQDCAVPAGKYCEHGPDCRTLREFRTGQHLAQKAAAHEVGLAAHLVYDHNQPKRLPATKARLVTLHATLHEVQQ